MGNVNEVTPFFVLVDVAEWRLSFHCLFLLPMALPFFSFFFFSSVEWLYIRLAQFPW